MTSADEETLSRWERLKVRWPFGREVEGVVAHHAAFGVFLDLGEGPRICGLILLPDLDLPAPVRPEQLPPPGSRLRGRVCGFRDANLQVWLTRRRLPPRAPIAPGDRVWAGGLRFGTALVVLPDVIVAWMEDTGRREVFSRHDLVRRDD
ncbi:MAG: hypothetical protein M9894_03355 [Planctomycetes bacterium]|nr:hypothetical protein [Planctomycetota bacterium]